MLKLKFAGWIGVLFLVNALMDLGNLLTLIPDFSDQFVELVVARHFNERVTNVR